MARSLNKVILIGNLTRDPELRYTPSGTAVATFSIATNRQWKTESGDTRDDAEFHRIVAWDKLAEICSQLLSKGKRTYVEGRLQTRKWTGKDEVERTTTEIVISEMILLDSGGGATQGSYDDSQDIEVPSEFDGADKKETQNKKQETKKAEGKTVKAEVPESKETEDDIPF